MRFRHALALLVLASVSSAPAWPDTIVLKNGRRITAASVTDDGVHVSYETSAGELSLPRSIVDHIEHNDLGSVSDTSQPPVSEPKIDASQGYEDVARNAVHDGQVDADYLEHLESAANSGNPVAIARVAAAHHAAAQFLLSKGMPAEAEDQYRRALTFAPDNLSLLLNLAMVYLRQSQFTAAVDPLEHAERIAPDSPDVPKLMGWAYFGQNKLDQAAAEWKRSLQLRDDPEVEGALKKTERDLQEEQSYREGETAHFDIKYYGGAAPDLAGEVLRALEEDFRDIESELDFTPPDQIGVILYTQQAFSDITRAPDWASAINDGRIRVPVQGLTSMTPELGHVLRHELTHSFISQKTEDRCPTWLQEGIAQWMEGRDSGNTAQLLLSAYQNNAAPNLANLEGSWLSLPSNSAGLAYAWSLAAVESIVQAGGTTDITRLLDEIAANQSPGDALRDVLRLSYSELNDQTADYLRKEYSH